MKIKKPKFPRCILPPNKVKPSKKVYDRKNHHGGLERGEDYKRLKTIKIGPSLTAVMMKGVKNEKVIQAS